MNTTHVSADNLLPVKPDNKAGSIGILNIEMKHALYNHCDSEVSGFSSKVEYSIT